MVIFHFSTEMERVQWKFIHKNFELGKHGDNIFASLNLFDDCIISIVTWVIPWFSKAFCCPGPGGRSCAKGPSPKNFNTRYFYTILRFVAIYAFYKALNACQIPISKYTLDEGIEAIFCVCWKPANFCHPVTMLPNHFYPNLIFSTDFGSTASEP